MSDNNNNNKNQEPEYIIKWFTITDPDFKDED